MVIVFLGPDGAGKSTLIRLVRDKLSRRSLNMREFYFAPGYLKRYRPIGKEKNSITTNPHEGKQYGQFLVFLKVCLLLFEFRMGLSRLRRDCQLLLFDRFIHDLLVDPRRYRMERVRWWMRLLLYAAPEPDLVIIVTAPPEVIQSRKQEVTIEETVRQVHAYRDASKFFSNACLIENVGPLAITADAIIGRILEND